jgi:hypothetical protein
MEMRKALMKSSKAQMMTILVLIMFLLMLSVLFAFALMNISADSTSQSLSTALSSSNYEVLLKQSAAVFARESASRALITMVNYEYNSSLRGGNFVSSFGFFASNLMVGGVLPNSSALGAGYTQNAMGNLTFSRYNRSVSTQLGLASQNVIINETTPLFFQTDPYHLRVTYVENVALNASGSSYRYSIPVNVSIPLNNTPDLFYAQDGVLSTVKFASLGNLTSQVGGTYAISGNSVGFAYGTVYNIPSNAVSSALCSSIPSPFSSLPASANVIIATYNAMSMNSVCVNSIGGLITYIPPSASLSAPYLVYSSTSGMMANVITGMKVLLYGPGMDTLNVENLRNAVMGGYYFASPFTPSYMDRSGANFLNQSPNGIFTFSNYNTQVGNFNALANSYVSTGYNGLPVGSAARSEFAWIYYTGNSLSTNYYVAFDYGIDEVEGLSGVGVYNGLLKTIFGGTVNNQGAFTLSANAWHFVGFTYAAGATTATLYLDSNSQTVTVNGGSALSTPSPNFACVGCDYSSGPLDPFSGSISNVQAYNVLLSPSQVQSLYQRGISGLPIPGNSLVGWWPLNGNANDLSGGGNNGAPTNMIYALPSNYVRDSILVSATPTPPQPVPGILSCTSNSQCSNSALPKLFISSMPLEVQSGLAQTGNFNGQTSYTSVSSTSLASANQITLVVWADELGSGNQAPREIMFSQYATYLDACYSGQSLFTVYNTGSSQYTAYAGTCPTVGVWRQYVGTYNGVDAVLYVNGVAGTPVAASGNLYAGPVWLGEYTSGSYNFNGLLANAQIYTNALSPSQVNTLYQEGIYGMPISNAGLVGWWPLNGNANDYSGNGHNGTAYNPPALAYPYLSGTYNAPGLSYVSSTANEWQALGLSYT